ncbi:hypothetical protein DSO57_1027404 [Entomophthora muscae]|uniref:Uncharacterized protein n=1 Tax=Entomophthora muscae TaxID=34485 RepID=A0ACC2T1N5_9FUNG|nr:hypothetical protein DSO57_1027404 [Entomophthora muscae]
MFNNTTFLAGSIMFSGCIILYSAPISVGTDWFRGLPAQFFPGYVSQPSHFQAMCSALTLQCVWPYLRSGPGYLEILLGKVDLQVEGPFFLLVQVNSFTQVDFIYLPGCRNPHLTICSNTCQEITPTRHTRLGWPSHPDLIPHTLIFLSHCIAESSSYTP